MKTIATLSLAAGVLFAGCGKKAGDAATAEGEGGADAAPVASGKVNPKLESELSAVDQKIEQAKYDDAVASLLQARAAAQSEADRQAYQKQLYEAQQALLEKAQTDPRARESYQNLGRIVTGR